MYTLKELRIRTGLRQSDLAHKLQKSISEISNYESGISIPELPEMIQMERSFTQRIDWMESINPEDKASIIQSICDLAEFYPIQAVLNFAQKAIRDGIKVDQPAIRIAHYAKVAKDTDIEPEPLLPTQR